MSWVRCAVYACAVLLAGSVTLSAQTWQVRTTDTGGLIYGTAYAPQNSLAFACNAPSPQGRPLIDTGDHETNRTGPFGILIEVSHVLVNHIGADPVMGSATMTVDGTGYRLPPIRWDDFYGAWQVELFMGDAMLDAMFDSQTLVFDAGRGTAWQYPVDGLSEALFNAMQVCIDGWVLQGQTIPVALNRFWPVVEEPMPLPQPGAGVPPLTGVPQRIHDFLIAGCEGTYLLDPARLGQADFDGDGRSDIILDWANVTCNGPIRRPFCGAANCSIDIFVSSRPPGTPPRNLLGVGYRLVAHPSGVQGIQLGGTAGACARGECDIIYRWTGSRFGA